MSCIIGIDPGLSGGIAWIDDDDIYAHPTPETDKDFELMLSGLASFYLDGLTAYVEKVSASPQMGVVSAFKFGRSVGSIHMALLANDIRIEYVTPQKWQKEFGLIVKGRGMGQDDTSKKNRNKAKAQELFPCKKITHAIADAMLIAEYGRRELSRQAAAT